MKGYFWGIFLIIIAINTRVWGQDTSCHFTKPMQLPFNIAGTFCEPRQDHFHSGIDIKTNGEEGVAVMTIANGYISRIRVSPYGYGKAIYITHPNGYTSVYGHLSKFYGAIETYIHQKMYLQKKSEIDLNLDSTLFKVHQKDTIAFSGNTGGSSAPHLHFEIRDTKSEYALNPLLFYAKEFYIDTIPPTVNSIKIYQFTNYFYNNINSIFPLKKDNANVFTTDSFIPIYKNYKFYFSLQGYDKQDFSENKNGIQKIEVLNGNELLFSYNITYLDFDKTRMCNAFIDYDELKKNNGYFYNCYTLKNNALDFYTPNLAGYASLYNKDTIHLTVNCYDINHNKTTVLLNFKTISTPIFTSILQHSLPNYSAIITAEKKEICSTNFCINFLDNTFYDNAEIHVNTNTVNATLQTYNAINNKQNIPLQKVASVKISSSINKKEAKKMVIMRKDLSGNEIALKTNFNKGVFYADTKELGTFYLKKDIIPPTVIFDSILNGNSIKVFILDTISGIDTYNGYIDKQWVNFYFDAKNNLLIYPFDEYCKKGKHTLKIIITDKVGNKTIKKEKFTYH